VSAESNSLYPKAQPMRKRDPNLSADGWIARMLKASTLASGVLGAAKDLDVEVVPVLRMQAL
jgi:hypothetical protein